MALFDNAVTRRQRFVGQYGSAASARNTLRRMKGKPCGFQRRIAGTMYARAKYHANQTRDMRAAMRVYKRFLRDGCTN